MGKFRKAIQISFAVLTNGYLVGFLTGRIYAGNLKTICVPGMNCYSCPGALGSCPIGSLQAALGGRGFQIPYYLLGFFLVMGTIFGRFICGFLCPFGLIQELLHKIPFIKKISTFKGDKILRLLKYFILVVFVILLPIFWVDFTGLGQPYFCKYICPVGTLEAGIPLVLTNEGLRETVGWLYLHKNIILLLTILASIIIYRPFCKYICPLGAIYSFFNKISLLRLSYSKERCIGCKKCSNACEMQVDPTKNTEHFECIRCLKCKNVCPKGAIAFGVRAKMNEIKSTGKEGKNEGSKTNN